MSRFPTEIQSSSGGVVFRRGKYGLEVILIRVGKNRWQLPKGLVNEGETPETTAVREVLEKTGSQTKLLGLIDKIEYWYVSTQRIRYHKIVYFYLLRYLSGDVANHDCEVEEARWFLLEDAGGYLSFENERNILQAAADQLSEESESS
jgi:8-oxo-dGTP pyrophosphatase MutT (NUDIX family)